jgi:hypothetical protein
MALNVSQRLKEYTQLTNNNLGALHANASSYGTVTEYGDGLDHTTDIYVASMPVVTGNTSGASFGSAGLYTFPEGGILIETCNAYFSSITFNSAAGATGDIDGAGSGDYSIGSTATADATLSTTDVNILPSTAMLDPFVVGVGRSNVSSILAAPASLLGNVTAITAYLNVIIDDADVADGAASDSVYFTGHIWIKWAWAGNVV